MKFWTIAVAAIFITAGASCGSETGHGADKKMSAKMRTQCVGRYLIDTPATFTWAESPDATLYFGLGADHKTVDVIVVENGSDPDKFLKRVSARANKIASEVNEASRSSMLVLNEQLTLTTVLLRYFDSSMSSNYHRHEMHVLADDVHVMLTAPSFEGVVEPVEARLKRLSSQTRKRDSSAGPGLCLGPVVINADHDHEEINTYARDHHRPDVLLSVYMSAITPDQEEGLIEQIEREKEAFSAGPKFLRKGRTTIGGMDAEEALMRFDEDGISMHSFAIWSKRPNPSFARPTITLNLNTGGEVSSNPRQPDPLRYGVLGEVDLDDSKTINSSLSDQEATVLWDTIVQSVRLRPGAVDK